MSDLIPCCENCIQYTGEICLNNGRIRKPGEWCPVWEESICSDACDLEDDE